MTDENPSTYALNDTCHVCDGVVPAREAVIIQCVPHVFCSDDCRDKYRSSFD